MLALWKKKRKKQTNKNKPTTTKKPTKQKPPPLQPCFCHVDPANTPLKSDLQIQYWRFVVNWEGPNPSLLELPVFWLERLLQFIKLCILYLTALSLRAESVKKSHRASLWMGVYWGKRGHFMVLLGKMWWNSFLFNTTLILWELLCKYKQAYWEAEEKPVRKISVWGGGKQD